jgi:glycosyltransferase involved in cell wall biosynthesis
MAAMRVLAYLYYPLLDRHLAGGLQVGVWTLMRGFLKRGHRIHVLCPGCDARPLIEAPGLKVMPVLREQTTATIPAADVSHNLEEIRAALKGVDVVWTLDRTFPAVISQPIVLSLSAICYPSELDALFRLRWDHLVVPSDYVARVVDSWLFRDRGRPAAPGRSCIPPPLDPIFHPRTDTAGIRSKLGLNGDSRYLLFPHRPESGKGHELALRVLEELRRHDRRFHLLVPRPPISRMMDAASESEYIRHIEVEAIRLGLRSHVTFHDWIDYPDLPEYYSLGECCLYLSQLPETFGLALVQSIACGTFVVSSGAGALKDAVPPDHANRVIPNLDPGTIASAVLRGCPQEERDCGRALVLERYAPDRIVDAYLDCFRAARKAATPWHAPVNDFEAKGLKRAVTSTTRRFGSEVARGAS